tara:strand:- start:94 stop:372 length:279 start_codon:yes stop_codon:yes gene_type:complete
MHIITIKNMKEDGAYAVINEFGEKVVFMFQEKDDAERYAGLLESNGDPEMEVIKVNDKVAITACERTGTRYTVISKNDIVFPPLKHDSIQKD